MVCKLNTRYGGYVMKKTLRSKVLYLVIAVLLLGMLTAGCSLGDGKNTSSSGTGDSKDEKVRYATLQGMSSLGFWFGKEKSFFEDAGINLETVNVEDPVAAFAAKEIDFADMNTTQAIIAASKGAPFKIVASMFRSKGPFYLIAKPSINKIEDLKGKRIGVAKIGSGLDAYVRVILKKHGIDPEKDVTLISNGKQQQALASLESDQVDATIIHQPFVELAEEKGVGKLLAKGWDYLPNFHTGVLVASDDFIKNNPEQLKKLIATYFKANEYAKANTEELLDFGTKYMNIERDVLKRALESEDIIWENNPEVDLSALEETQNIQIELGFQKEKYDVSKIVDTRFLPGK
jgi:NitT/TauT family transport system substrate-binding protein